MLTPLRDEDIWRNDTMSDEEESEEEKKSPEERRKKIREKMQEMREEGEAPGPRSLQGGGLSALMQRMAGGRGGSQQNRAMMEAMKGLRADMQEVKDYLKRIADALEKE